MAEARADVWSRSPGGWLMRRFLLTSRRITWRLVAGLPFAVCSPLVLLLAALSFALCDLFCRLRPRISLPADSRPDTGAASVVIPNWNGRDLLEKYLPSVLAAISNVSG